MFEALGACSDTHTAAATLYKSGEIFFFFFLSGEMVVLSYQLRYLDLKYSCLIDSQHLAPTFPAKMTFLSYPTIKILTWILFSYFQSDTFYEMIGGIGNICFKIYFFMLKASII